MLVLSRDSSVLRVGTFVHHFDRMLRTAGVSVIKTPFRAPNANAHAERWARSVKGECLNHLVLFGMNSLRRAISAYRNFHNRHRPHQGIGNRVPREVTAALEGHASACPANVPDGRPAKVKCTEFLGGLLKSYSRKAA